MTRKPTLLVLALLSGAAIGASAPASMAASLFYDIRIASQPSNTSDCLVTGAEKTVGCTGLSGYGKNASVQEATTTAPFSAAMTASSSTQHGATGSASLFASVLQDAKLMSVRTQSTGSTVDLGIGTNTQSFSSVELRLTERILIHVSPSFQGEVIGTFNMPYDGVAQTYAMHNNAPLSNQNGVTTGSISLEVSDPLRGLLAFDSATLPGSVNPLAVSGVVSTGPMMLRAAISSASVIALDVNFRVAIGQFTSYFQDNDFRNTFGFNVLLPDGVTATSESGLLDTFLTPVPEPAAYAMLLAGLFVLLGHRRVRTSSDVCRKLARSIGPNRRSLGAL